jgi:hypothetical protein
VPGLWAMRCLESCSGEHPFWTQVTVSLENIIFITLFASCFHCLADLEIQGPSYKMKIIFWS